MSIEKKNYTNTNIFFTFIQNIKKFGKYIVDPKFFSNFSNFLIYVLEHNTELKVSVFDIFEDLYDINYLHGSDSNIIKVYQNRIFHHKMTITNCINALKIFCKSDFSEINPDFKNLIKIISNDFKNLSKHKPQQNKYFTHISYHNQIQYLQAYYYILLIEHRNQRVDFDLIHSFSIFFEFFKKKKDLSENDLDCSKRFDFSQISNEDYEFILHIIKYISLFLDRETIQRIFGEKFSEFSMEFLEFYMKLCKNNISFIKFKEKYQRNIIELISNHNINLIILKDDSNLEGLRYDLLVTNEKINKNKFLIKFSYSLGEKMLNLSKKIQLFFEEILLSKVDYCLIEIDTIYWEKKTIEEKKNFIDKYINN